MYERFSALQRAENSSIARGVSVRTNRRRFQCSSASRKFLNWWWCLAQPACLWVSVLFSEPKIPQYRRLTRCFRPSTAVSVLFSEPKIPQSIIEQTTRKTFAARFSALQRAENSSIYVEFAANETALLFQCSSASRKFLNCAGGGAGHADRRVSVLFSEPKIPQYLRTPAASPTLLVSVLFSEPKIPQSSG